MDMSIGKIGNSGYSEMPSFENARDVNLSFSSVSDFRNQKEQRPSIQNLKENIEGLESKISSKSVLKEQSQGLKKALESQMPASLLAYSILL